MVKEWKREDASCLIDSHHGWHGHSYMMNMATVSGYPISPDDRDLLFRYKGGDRFLDASVNELVIGQGGLLDRAEAWMNENCAPAGYFFGWHEGAFYLAHGDWWAQDAAGWPDEVGPLDIHGHRIY